MTEWPYSIVLICPAAVRDDANLLACALGYDVLPGATYSVELSADGAPPATHYACRPAARQDFVDVLGAASTGALPPIVWADFGLTPERVQAVVDVLLTDIRAASGLPGQFDEALAAYGLARIPGGV